LVENHTWRRLQNGLRYSRSLEANASLLGNEIAKTALEWERSVNVIFELADVQNWAYPAMAGFKARSLSPNYNFVGRHDGGSRR
jgi:hypothetical protein